MQEEAFQNTSWLNHFETQNIKIGGLSNELYEFKTVGRNDYPDDDDANSRSESPASDVTDGRPLPSITGKFSGRGWGGGNLADSPFECCFTEVIPLNNF